jgi:pyrimidine operon attenuation protein/uracil phosphoribosyltransferase
MCRQKTRNKRNKKKILGGIWNNGLMIAKVLNKYLKKTPSIAVSYFVVLSFGSFNTF